MNISPMDPQMTIPCGICRRNIPAIKLRNPVSVSSWDKANHYVREYVHNCCGQTWLYSMTDDGSSESQGVAIEA